MAGDGATIVASLLFMPARASCQPESGGHIAIASSKKRCHLPRPDQRLSSKWWQVTCIRAARSSVDTDTPSICRTLLTTHRLLRSAFSGCSPRSGTAASGAVGAEAETRTVPELITLGILECSTKSGFGASPSNWQSAYPEFHRIVQVNSCGCQELGKQIF